VIVAAPAEVGESLREAGLAHAPFEHAGGEALAPIWARVRAVPSDGGDVIAVREIFAGASARAVLTTGRGIEAGALGAIPNLTCRSKPSSRNAKSSGMRPPSSAMEARGRFAVRWLQACRSWLADEMAALPSLPRAVDAMAAPAGTD
jgi:hypothetical protein